ncbi:MAG TPA: O-antigen ligase family protein [Pyrinomonadaceae bacterium]
MKTETRQTGAHADPSADAGSHARLQDRPQTPFTLRAASALILSGMTLYAASAPHSIAGSWIGLGVAALGWLWRVLLTKQTGISRTALDLPIWLFVGWTLLSLLFSAEPRLSLSKLPSISTFLIFYLAQATLTRRMAVGLAALMIVSGVAGVLWSVTEVARGRGVVVEEIAPESPLARHVPQLKKGDAVWRVGSRRVDSVTELDEAIRQTPEGTPFKLFVIAGGEHVVWEVPGVGAELKEADSPSGIRGERRMHRFRASGWTRHYQTFAEMLQMLAQLALGFALAAFMRRRGRRQTLLPAAAFALLATGIALTAMRTVLVAFAVGACVIAWRATTEGRTQFAVSFIVVLALALGAFAVWRTRATGALWLRDDSAALRLSVARRAVERVPLHPVFGHGMDAVNLHWQEWGFPGDETVHMHSTWVQLAFDRGVPALIFWLLIIGAFWLLLARAERIWSDADSAATHGFILGTTGALAGFFASSLVNYNFGDAEVAILLWWLMGATVRTVSSEQ